jgi:tripartite-type tricarboxylate transporter receptor subunit TctC
MNRKFLLAPALMLALVLPVAHADTWPTKSITLVVPSSPGGSTDFTARLVAEPLGKALGQNVIVLNKPGASGNIGTEAVANAAPDGYTLLMQYSGYHILNPLLFRHIRWKTSDFAPVAMAMRAPHVVAVRENLPVTSLKELIAYGKSGHDLLYASSGYASVQHVAGALFGLDTGIPVTQVAYKGAGPAVTDLLGGRVDMFITTPPSVITQAQHGTLKLLCYAASKRHPSMSEVPTCTEAGLPGYDVSSWFAVFAPAGTPAPIIAKLTTEIKKIVASESYRRKMEKQGAFAEYMDPPTLGKFVSAELAKWGKVVKEAGIQPKN